MSPDPEGTGEPEAIGALRDSPPESPLNYTLNISTVQTNSSQGPQEGLSTLVFNHADRPVVQSCRLVGLAKAVIGH